MSVTTSSTMVVDVIAAHPLHNVQRGHVVDVTCPLCSQVHQYYATTQNDYFHKSPPCEGGRSNRLLKFKFDDSVLVDLAKSKVEPM